VSAAGRTGEHRIGVILPCAGLFPVLRVLASLRPWTVDLLWSWLLRLPAVVTGGGSEGSCRRLVGAAGWTAEHRIGVLLACWRLTRLTALAVSACCVR
jgi:hypothetical protein